MHFLMRRKCDHTRLIRIVALILAIPRIASSSRLTSVAAVFSDNLEGPESIVFDDIDDAEFALT
jgi:hypothetical protein